jgi:hypothetical protein
MVGGGVGPPNGSDSPGSSDGSPHDDRLLQRTAVEVNRRQHGYPNGRSEDLRRTIVSAVRGGMSKAQARGAVAA